MSQLGPTATRGVLGTIYRNRVQQARFPAQTTREHQSRWDIETEFNKLGFLLCPHQISYFVFWVKKQGKKCNPKGPPLLSPPYFFFIHMQWKALGQEKKRAMELCHKQLQTKYVYVQSVIRQKMLTAFSPKEYILFLMLTYT